MATRQQGVDYFLVLDFEATCDEKKTPDPQEIIEFPTVALNSRTLTTDGEFHTYVKPTAHPHLTPFCTALTGITQQMVDSGVEVGEALRMHREWMIKTAFRDGKSFAFVTCGAWDLRTCLPSEMRKKGMTVPEYFTRPVLNIKTAFVEITGGRPLGMAGMLRALGLKLDGRHHSGIDDARNITKILVELIHRGFVFRGTSAAAAAAAAALPATIPEPPPDKNEALIRTLVSKATPELVDEARATRSGATAVQRICDQVISSCMKDAKFGATYRALPKEESRRLRATLFERIAKLVS